MKIRMDLGPDAVLEIIKDNAGEAIAVVFSPEFVSRKAIAVISYGACITDKGDIVDRFAITASGGTGKIRKISRQAPVTSAVDEGDVQEEEEEDDGE